MHKQTKTKTKTKTKSLLPSGEDIDEINTQQKLKQENSFGAGSTNQPVQIKCTNKIDVLANHLMSPTLLPSMRVVD